MTRSSESNSRGADLALRHRSGIKKAESALKPGARDLAILRGVLQNCGFSRPQENVLNDLEEMLVNSTRVFRYGNQTVFESINTGSKSLAILTTDRKVERGASGRLANLVVCEITSADSETTIQFPLPQKLVELIFTRDPTFDHLPAINVYATQPVFDPNYHWRNPAWHPDVGYLIHGEDIEPIIPVYNTEQAKRNSSLGNVLTIFEVRSRLPPRLRELLIDFPFRSGSDLVNAVAAMLTGLLVTHFIDPGKPIFVLDGNQSSIGKTLFARLLGTLFGRQEPPPIKYTTDDSELGKKVCATLRGGRSTVLLIDNAKLSGGAVESAFLEANSTAPGIAERILGQSTNYERPNDLLWVLTMNGTKLGPDLTERSCPIRLHYEGEVDKRSITNPNLIKFVRRHRPELIGELAGMVIHWDGAGRTPGTQAHRLREWAHIVGGVLDTNGLHGFLGNLAEAKADFNSAFDQLAALAEAAVRQGGPVVHTPETHVTIDGDSETNRGVLARELAQLFISRAGVLAEKIAAANSQSAKSTIMGAYLSPHIGRSVSIEVDRRRGQATLRHIDGRSNSKRYYFEILWDPTEDSTAPTMPPPGTVNFHAAATAAANIPPANSGDATATAPAPAGGNGLEW